MTSDLLTNLIKMSLLVLTDFKDTFSTTLSRGLDEGIDRG